MSVNNFRDASDILFLNYKSQDLIKAESIYELQEHLSFTSFSRSKKFKLARLVIINNIEKLTRVAENKLLKILEEPPESSVIIMTTSRQSLISKTILSRCVKWHLSPPTVGESLDILKKFCNKINVKAEEQQLLKILKENSLSPGTSINIIIKYQLQENPAISRIMEIIKSHNCPDMLELSKLTGSNDKLNQVTKLTDLLELALNRAYRESIGIRIKDSSFFSFLV